MRTPCEAVVLLSAQGTLDAVGDPMCTQSALAQVIAAARGHPAAAEATS